MILDIIAVILLVLLNGFFVAAEFAIVKVRASQVELLAKEGSRAAKVARKIIDDLNPYLSATQLGITLASLALGWIGEEAIGEIMVWAVEMMHLDFDTETVKSFSLPFSFFVITFMHIVFGELAPKSLAIQKPETTALAVSIPLQLFYKIGSPFIWMLNSCANVILKISGIDPHTKHEGHSAEELKLILKQGMESGAIKSTEQELIENVFEFNETTAKQIMVPRTKIFALEVSASDDEIMSHVLDNGNSRIPVYKENIDDVVGVIHSKDLLSMVSKGDTIVLSDILRPAYFIPETKKIDSLLKDFQRRRTHMAVVLDEFGGTSGIVTMEDILEELVGEIQDEYDEEIPIVEKIGEKQFIVDAMASVRDINQSLRYPLPEGDDFDTMAGFMNFIFGKIPTVNEKKNFGGYEFTIMKMDGNSVESVKMVELLTEED